MLPAFCIVELAALPHLPLWNLRLHGRVPRALVTDLGCCFGAGKEQPLREHYQCTRHSFKPQHRSVGPLSPILQIGNQATERLGDLPKVM